MFLKYQHVRNGGLLAALGGTITAVVISTSGGADPEPAAPPTPAASAQPVLLTRGQSPTLSASELVSLAELSSGGQAKRKDALGAASPWKVNLYDDNQDGRWDRLKLDRDRDGAWDEAWSRDELARWRRDGDGAVWRNGAWRGGEGAPASERAGAKPSDALVMGLATKPSGKEAKAKDALGSKSAWKVNLYDDDQDGAWDRVKIDRDRDERWDTSWTHKSGQWRRDGSGELWRDGQWVLVPAHVKTPAPTAGAAAAGPASKVAEAMAGRATSKKIKDLYRGSGPKVNLYDDDRDGVWDRAKIDLDRDGAWDEKLSRKASGLIERKVEASGQVFSFEGGAWVEER